MMNDNDGEDDDDNSGENDDGKDDSDDVGKIVSSPCMQVDVSSYLLGPSQHIPP